jgi:hypothetical protein
MDYSGLQRMGNIARQRPHARGGEVGALHRYRLAERIDVEDGASVAARPRLEVGAAHRLVARDREEVVGAGDVWFAACVRPGVARGEGAGDAGLERAQDGLGQRLGVGG